MAERLYTLEEAKRELFEAECRQYGHRWCIVVNGKTNKPESLTCERCGVTYRVVPEVE